MTFDWDHMRAFLAAAEHGSLSAAARAVGAQQPTLSRHVSALEAQLGVRLFDRTGEGLRLTDTGADVLVHAQAMQSAADAAALTAAGQSEAIAGVVRITASDIMSMYALPAVLTTLRDAEPAIDVELVSSDRTENLLRREADIAVRMYRPTQNDVITRHVGDISLAIFAATSYLERHGRPQTMADLQHHRVIGYDRDDHIIRGFHDAGLTVTREFFPFRCDDQVVCWQMVVAGYGVGFNQRRTGLATPGVEQILHDAPIPTLPVWLTAHAELRTSRRVRRVFDVLARELRRLTD